MLSGVPALVAGLVTAKGQRVGDLVAGTYVVRDKLDLGCPRRSRCRSPWPPGRRTADIAPLPEGLAVAVRQLLGRLDTLGPDARQRLLVSTADADPHARRSAPARQAPRRRPSSPRSRPSAATATPGVWSARPRCGTGWPPALLSRSPGRCQTGVVLAPSGRAKTTTLPWYSRPSQPVQVTSTRRPLPPD